MAEITEEQMEQFEEELRTKGFRAYRDKPLEFKNNPKFAVIAAEHGIWRSLTPEMKNNKEVARMAVMIDSNVLKSVSRELRDDRDILVTAAEFSLAYGVFEYASDRLQKDKAVLTAAAKREDNIFLDYIPAEYLDDEEFVLGLLRNATRSNGMHYISERLRSDREFMLKAVKANCQVLTCASKELKDDEEIVTEALKRDERRGYSGGLLYCVSKRLQDSIPVVLEALKTNSRALESASERLKSHKPTVLFAVTHGWDNLWKASASLKDDYDVVLAAVTSKRGYGHNDALRCASPRLRDFEDIVRASTIREPSSLAHASDRLKDKKDMLLEVLVFSGDALQHASTRLQNDKVVVLRAVQKSGKALRWASETLKDDRDVVLTALMQDCLSLEFASDRLKATKEVVMVALATWNARRIECLRHLPDALFDDAEIMLIAMAKIHGEGDWEEWPMSRVHEVGTVSSRLLTDRDFLLDAVTICGHDALNKLTDKELREDPVFVKIATERELGLERKAAEWEASRRKQKKIRVFCEDREAALDLIREDASNLKRVGWELRNDDEFLLEAFAIDGLALEHSCQLGGKKDIVAIKQNGKALLWASEYTLDDKELVLEGLGSIDRNQEVVRKIVDRLPTRLRTDRDAFCAAMRKYEVPNDPQTLYDDEEFIMDCLRTGFDVFSFASQRLKNEMSVVVAAVEVSPKNISHVPLELLMSSDFLNRLAAAVQFHDHLKRLGKDKLVYAGEDFSTLLCRNAWVDVLAKCSSVAPSQMAASALFYFLSQNPALCF
ncbi:expressed unknown protein [Seminavis robusta]|uniref:DUF4116 domain-containing protein n=1 Tax=Seminavis robusta TaxID=568900 RepID=A0A9N8EV10_9STRA|nr:expressed unknown protein [Seminavis robusta]|eukprot:Sro1959_g307980.1 n/a (780) ;mRNA; r:13948-16287